MSSWQDTYGAGIETLEEVSKIVDSLYAKVRTF
jgi:26S proteasome subunit RPN6 C-terminal helix domain